MLLSISIVWFLTILILSSRILLAVAYTQHLEIMLRSFLQSSVMVGFVMSSLVRVDNLESFLKKVSKTDWVVGEEWLDLLLLWMAEVALLFLRKGFPLIKVYSFVALLELVSSIKEFLVGGLHIFILLIINYYI